MHIARPAIAVVRVEEHYLRIACARGRGMLDQDAGFDFPRYRQLLAEAVDEKKRLALIALLIEERAKDRLEVQRAADQVVVTATTIAQVLGSSRPDIAGPSGAADPPAPTIARGVVSG